MSVITVQIEKIVSGGDGLARTPEGKVLFVPFSAPGEICSVQYQQTGKDFERGKIVSIIEPVPERREPRCPYYYRCGGCSFQHITYPLQLSVKQQAALEAALRAGLKNREEQSLPARILASPEWHYRSRFRFRLSSEGQYGLRERQSSRVVSIARCPVAVEEVNSFLESAPLSGERILTVFGAGGSVYTSSPEETEAEVIILGKPIRFPVSGFFQSNVPALEKLLTEVLPWIDHFAGGRGVDLYAGSGLFGVFAAPFFEDFVSVEPDSRSAARAEVNIPGSAVFCGSAEEWIKRFGKNYSPDLIICDPPRSGLSSRVRDYIGRSGAEGLLYISCDPVTFARDGAELKEKGYRLVREILCDFFPQTPHVETAGLFQR